MDKPPWKPRSAELRLGREMAVRVLYAADVGQLADSRAFALCQAHFLSEESHEAEVVESASAIARWFVAQVLDDRPALDSTIRQSSKRWKVSRMQPVERNILRLGTFELRARIDRPRDVIYDHVELAKRFGDANTPSFVNGILDQIGRDTGILKAPRKA